MGLLSHGSQPTYRWYQETKHPQLWVNSTLLLTTSRTTRFSYRISRCADKMDRNLQWGTKRRSLLLEQTLPNSMYQRITTPRTILTEAFWVPTPKIPQKQQNKNGRGMSIKKLWRQTMMPPLIHQKHLLRMRLRTFGEARNRPNDHISMETS